MLRLSALDFFFRTIPESFLIVMVAYIFSNKKIYKLRFIEASLILSFVTYLVRLLPISFGVNTIINMVAFIIIGVYILKMNVNISIISIFISVILISFCEWVNVFIMIKINYNNKFLGVYSKVLYGIPSLIMFMIIVFIIYIFMNKINRRFKDVFH